MSKISNGYLSIPLWTTKSIEYKPHSAIRKLVLRHYCGLWRKERANSTFTIFLKYKFYDFRMYYCQIKVIVLC